MSLFEYLCVPFIGDIYKIEVVSSVLACSQTDSVCEQASSVFVYVKNGKAVNGVWVIDDLSHVFNLLAVENDLYPVHTLQDLRTEVCKLKDIKYQKKNARQTFFYKVRAIIQSREKGGGGN